MLHLKTLKTSGTILQSSDHTIQGILKYIPFENKLNILELGAGDGCITIKILDKMNSDSFLTSFELNTDFYDKYLAPIRDKRFKVINDSAENILTQYQNNFIPKFDIILSTLPLNMMSKETVESILNQVTETMNSDSVFIQASHNPFIKQSLKNKFKIIHTELIIRNMPPYIIYFCKKKS